MTIRTSFLDAICSAEKGLIAFVGAGGKTSLIKRISKELFDSGKKVAVTTTTKMRLDEIAEFWNPSHLDMNSPKIGDLIEEAMARSVVTSLIPLFYSRIENENKIIGIKQEVADKIYKFVDYLLVEADGAKGASFKIPRENEPVVPDSTTVVCIVIGSEIFELPAGEGLFFNFQEISKLASVKEGTVASPQIIRKLLLLDNGYIRYARKGCQTVLIINKVDSAEKIADMLPKVDELYCNKLDMLILASSKPGMPVVEVNNAGDRITAVIPAAGKSTRFGRQKLCETIDGEPMILRTVRQALESKLDSVCVVLGHGADLVSEKLAILKSHTALMIIKNPDYEAGMGSSIAEGVMSVSQWTDAIMVIPADMPGITTELIDIVVESYKKSRARLCFPVVNGRNGHPVIFRREFFNELSSLSGEEGGKKIVEKNIDRAKIIEIFDEKTQLDIDTQEDLKKFQNAL